MVRLGLPAVSLPLKHVRVPHLAVVCCCIVKQTNGKNYLPKQIVRKTKRHRFESWHSLNRYYARTPVTLQQSLSYLLAIMKGFSSFVLVTMAFIKMTAAAPTVLERSSDVDKRTENLVVKDFSETEDLDKRSYITFAYLASEEETPETEDLVAEETPETEDLDKRSYITFAYLASEETPETEDLVVEETPETEEI
ncbi:hypothetical protein K503DRAFT_775544 [Rhizopogon vinicolor AM-OR11-026]|uniref:Uncharacterized protein n=1 Tax=Rhizopogon vinicolor AM-OR11-026 TaxID=1314800 RepID=A0A1B7MLN0_9AGAM|nr:hypothetical protein K503DRAFT_775544 [Rhizopogon vinicolor AM-OR11-026]